MSLSTSCIPHHAIQLSLFSVATDAETMGALQDQHRSDQQAMTCLENRTSFAESHLEKLRAKFVKLLGERGWEGAFKGWPWKGAFLVGGWMETKAGLSDFLVQSKNDTFIAPWWK